MEHDARIQEGSRDDYTVLAVVNTGKPREGARYGRAPRLDYDEAVSSV
jgi:hypothetical protein